ncbi:hypothetical protein [Actinokineospora diospyrosa]|uniref:hypothetical protein n=1 Tax=Actinokineospora diospyrosa TaxID=103728 RepID=UPI0020A3DC86|nr:hypothetical protein [Actinokineospora diospyrosa]
MDIDERQKRRQQYLDLLSKVAPDEAADQVTFDMLFEAHLRQRRSGLPRRPSRKSGGALAGAGLAETVVVVAPWIFWALDKVLGVAVEQATKSATRRMWGRLTRKRRAQQQDVRGETSVQQIVDDLVANHGFPAERAQTLLEALEQELASDQSRDSGAHHDG